MSFLNKISFYQNRRYAVPDQELAEEIAGKEVENLLKSI